MQFYHQQRFRVQTQQNRGQDRYFKQSRSSTRKNLFPLISTTNRKSKQINIKQYQQFREGVGKSVSFSTVTNDLIQPSLSRIKSKLCKYSKNQLSSVRVSSYKTVIHKPKAKGSVKEYAWNTYQGSRKYNQDRVSINDYFQVAGKVYQYFAIFDGHGGSFTSQFLYNNFVKFIHKHLRDGSTVTQSLKKSFTDAESRIQSLYKLNKKDRSGSCALIAIVDGQEIVVANIGDSRAILIKNKQNISQISVDHKPQNQRSRLQSFGCKIYKMKSLVTEQPMGPYRIWPSKLSVSRAIGDIYLKNSEYGSAISSIPDIIVSSIQRQSILVLMSDGAYQTMTNQQIGTFFCQYSISESIDKIIISSITKGSTDNLSIAAIKFN